MGIPQLSLLPQHLSSLPFYYKESYTLFANIWATWSRVPKSGSKFLKLSFYHTLRVKVGVKLFFFFFFFVSHLYSIIKSIWKSETSLWPVSALHSRYLLLQDLISTEAFHSIPCTAARSISPCPAFLTPYTCQIFNGSLLFSRTKFFALH